MIVSEMLQRYREGCFCAPYSKPCTECSAYRDGLLDYREALSSCAPPIIDFYREGTSAPGGIPAYLALQEMSKYIFQLRDLCNYE